MPCLLATRRAAGDGGGRTFKEHGMSGDDSDPKKEAREALQALTAKYGEEERRRMIEQPPHEFTPNTMAEIRKIIRDEVEPLRQELARLTAEVRELRSAPRDPDQPG